MNPWVIISAMLVFLAAVSIKATGVVEPVHLILLFWAFWSSTKAFPDEGKGG